MATKKKKVTATESTLTTSQSLDALRDKVSAALQDCFGSASSSAFDDTTSPWIKDLFLDKVVYSLDGTLYQVPYNVSSVSGEEKITFGTPLEVQVAYTTVGESHRIMARESVAISEASSYDAATGQLTMTVIAPGMNKAQTRFYPASVLKRDHGIFEGAKMFADHATDAESKQRPEGSVNNWVANVKKVWAENDGTVKATAVVIDPPFKAKLATLAENKLLHEMGVSIRAVGEASQADVEGVKTNMVERLISARSVDFVTYAGAGGRVEAMESDRNDENDVELITEAQLRARRPDLIAIVESHAREESETMKTAEQEIKEANDRATAAEAKAAKAETDLAEANKSVAKATASTELTKLLTESKLPAPAQERLKKQFAEAVKVDGMKEAITAEADYIKSIAPASAGGVRNLGTSTSEVKESGDKPDLVKSFQLMGLTEAQAKIAARGL